ncbi:hypothetical protein OEA41_010577 [Lepraria neglecta]|uniref:Alpha/beta hydrolase fold-3 domain-containing protein n=1 Tax=Lepraria neglecta TaxID=209136 RepID=A0AAD9YWV2_9LECA|nr:hypothetical protein OEA41_010577 [Lepraria neglecta]
MDTSSPTAIARLLLPKVPLLFKAAIWHSLWLSPTSTKWDLKTELIVKMLRSLLNSPHPTPISKQQKHSLRDPGIKGKMWISKVTLPAPEEDVRGVLVKAVDEMREGGEIYTAPEIVPVEAEWTGYRANVDAHRPRLDLTEAQHYERLMSEVNSDVTILYFHGGAFFLMDPATHRVPTSHLAKLTGGRLLSVRYRLAPQHAFPSALLDALIAYLSLLYPPPGSYHTPVSASHIIFSGDSAGGGLCISLVQLLLQINRSTSSSQKTISFHGQTVTLPLPLPAGCATQSPWTDMTRSMPSINLNAEYDYLPPPLTAEKASTYPHCDIWPTTPPRGDLYCDVSMLCHPLVSPLAAKDWSGSCPLLLLYGEEMLADEAKIIATRAARQGVAVVSEQWEAMPHCFAMIFLGSPMAKRCFADLTSFCKVVIKGVEPETRGLWFEVKTQKETEVEVEELAVIGDEEVRERMARAREARDLGIEGEAKILPKL